jgi:N-acetylglucosaminyldiphosphoundecaprenol N-acetyl-beta-D-mannosaminyltransferase
MIAERLNLSFKHQVELKREGILGINISILNLYMALEQLEDWITTGKQKYVCVAPAHSIMEGYNQPALKRIFNESGMTTPDGMAVVWLLKLRGHHHVQRVYGPDLLLATCAYGLKRGYRHYFYGGEQGVVETLVDRLCAKYSGLQVAGTFTPPFQALTAKDDQKIIDQINVAHADILWVGLGSPKQEYWMHAHLGRLKVPVMIGVGAAFDFLSGRKPQAPLWMQRSGLEWLFRFSNEPRRLWPRYRQYPKFVLLAILELIGMLQTRS